MAQEILWRRRNQNSLEATRKFYVEYHQPNQSLLKSALKCHPLDDSLWEMKERRLQLVKWASISHLKQLLNKRRKFKSLESNLRKPSLELVSQLHQLGRTLYSTLKLVKSRRSNPSWMELLRGMRKVTFEFLFETQGNRVLRWQDFSETQFHASD